MPVQYTENPAELYRAATDNTIRVVRGVQSEQLGGPTPCSEWNVSDLIMHCIGGQQYAAGMLTGKPTGIEFGGIDTLEPVEADVDVMAAEYQRSISGVLAAAVNATFMARTITLPIGEISGAEFVFTEFMDQLVHGWDLAVATGQDATLDPVLAAAAYTLFQPGGLYGPDSALGSIATAIMVPETASSQDKLLAAVGRQP